eukprot:6757427-Alexandrium_andersonii.AAC.1
MSASLVGSEMCIRDSAAQRVQRRVHVATICARRNLAGTRAPNALGAVSYTHLTLPTICSV